jgi:putative endonuclease
MSYSIYVIYNKQVKKIYIGQTGNLKKRLLEHNNKKGNHYTAKFIGSWKLIYEEKYQTRKESLKREKQLKSFRGREFIKKLII